MGDFNSKIGQREINKERVMGPYNYGSRNERGNKLIINFCQENNLKIVNSYFQKDQI